MRVYLPTTLAELAAAHACGEFGSGTAHGVTAAVREWYVAGDEEELEFAALLDAARSSLRLIAADGGCPRRRVVVAADVPDAAVRPCPGSGRSAVTVREVISLSVVASVHVDEPEAVAAVTAAVAALPAADAGDDDARFLLDEAEACDLLWYDVTEIPHLI